MQLPPSCPLPSRSPWMIITLKIGWWINWWGNDSTVVWAPNFDYIWTIAYYSHLFGWTYFCLCKTPWWHFFSVLGCHAAALAMHHQIYAITRPSLHGLSKPVVPLKSNHVHGSSWNCHALGVCLPPSDKQPFEKIDIFARLFAIGSWCKACWRSRRRAAGAGTTGFLFNFLGLRKWSWLRTPNPKTKAFNWSEGRFWKVTFGPWVERPCVNSSSVLDGSLDRNGVLETSRATLSSFWACQIALVVARCEFWDRSRNPFSPWACQIALVVVLCSFWKSRRSCAKILGRRSFIESLRGDLDKRCSVESLYRDLARRPLIESLHGGLAQRFVAEILPRRDLAKRPLAWRCLRKIWYRDLW